MSPKRKKPIVKAVRKGMLRGNSNASLSDNLPSISCVFRFILVTLYGSLDETTFWFRTCPRVYQVNHLKPRGSPMVALIPKPLLLYPILKAIGLVVGVGVTGGRKTKATQPKNCESRASRRIKPNYDVVRLQKQHPQTLESYDIMSA